MANPFKPGDRVIVTSNHSQRGDKGTVYCYSQDDDCILVTIDNDTGARQWHHTHFTLIGE